MSPDSVKYGIIGKLLLQMCWCKCAWQVHSWKKWEREAQQEARGHDYMEGIVLCNPLQSLRKLQFENSSTPQILQYYTNTTLEFNIREGIFSDALEIL